MDGFPLWLDQLWPWHTRALFLRSHDEIIDSTARPGHPGFACYNLQDICMSLLRQRCHLTPRAVMHLLQTAAELSLWWYYLRNAKRREVFLCIIVSACR